MSNTEMSNLPEILGTPTGEDESNDLMEFFRRMAEERSADSDDEENAEGAEKSADECHNDAVDFAHRGNYKRAAQVCMNGLKRFPNNIDLLADTVKYSSDAGDFATAEEYYNRLAKIPHSCWNWRAFTFSFDYLVQNVEANEKACRDIIADYKRYLPHEEKAYMSESELESACGNREQSLNVLINAIEQLPNAPQCALRLADMQMERGMYSDVIKTSDYGLSASCEVQPSINIPYLLLVRTLAKDALLHQRNAKGEKITAEEIDALLTEYATLENEFLEVHRHDRILGIRQKCLKFMKVTV